QAQGYLISGNIPKPTGSKHPMIVPSQALPTAHGRYIVISPSGAKFWGQFCDAIGRPDLADDPRYVTGAKRLENEAELEKILRQTFSEKPLNEWMEILQKARMPAAPIQNVAEALSHPLVSLRNMRVRV